MKFLLGFLSLLAVGLRILIMLVAYVVVSIAGWLEAAQEWMDHKRGVAIVQVGEKDMDDICSDFTVAQRRAWLNTAGYLSLMDAAQALGEDAVYWAIFNHEIL